MHLSIFHCHLKNFQKKLQYPYKKYTALFDYILIMQPKALAWILVIFSLIGGIFWSLIVNIFSSTSSLPFQEKVISKTTKTLEITDLQNTITSLVTDISPSVVSIIIKKDITLYRGDVFWFFSEPVGTITRKVWWGTGFFITQDGKIITNKHVVSDPNAEYVVITSDGKEYDAKVLAFDPLTDLAIVSVVSPANFIPLEFVKDTLEVNIGEFAIAIGNALAEFQNSVSFGVVSGKDRAIAEGEVRLSGLIQTDAAINPGNSGWPLLNIDKKVIGINTAIVNGAEGVGFAIWLTQKKIDYILSSIEKNGEIKRPFIGIYYTLVTKENKKDLWVSSDYGAYISAEKWGIVAGSPAEKAWLKEGDIILKIDGKKVDHTNDLAVQIQNRIPGEELVLEVLKNGKIENISLTLTES